MIWRERNAEARRRGYFLPTEREAARDWDSCAVGEQTQQAPDIRGLNPGCFDEFDDSLMRLGMDFYGAVLACQFDRVDVLLDKIAERAMAVKRGEPSVLPDSE